MEGYLSHEATSHEYRLQFYLSVLAAQGSSPSTVMSAPTASIPLLSIPDTCGDVRNQITAVESDDEPRCVLAEHLLHNVAFAEIASNLSQRELLQFRNVVLIVGSASVHSENMNRRNLVGQSVDRLR